jgi:hypothetical protein
MKGYTMNLNNIDEKLISDSNVRTAKTIKSALFVFERFLSTTAISVLNEVAAIAASNTIANIVQHTDETADAIKSLITKLVEIQAELKAFGDNPDPLIVENYGYIIELYTNSISVVKIQKLTIYK